MGDGGGSGKRWGTSQCVTFMTFQLWLLDLATRGRLLIINVITIKYLLLHLKFTITIKKNSMDSVPVDSVLVIPGPFWNPPEFRGTEMTILAGSTAKISIPRNSWNRPESTGFRQILAGIHGGL